ncbi:hypothetical protein PM082_013678 [Marasmius tenuissimus]|nr:hypothetical protein PM082_013678 [Marasmius tenuissimus]
MQRYKDMANIWTTARICIKDCCSWVQPTELLHRRAMSEPTQQGVDELLTMLDAGKVVGSPIATLTTTYFFYGLYTVLVMLCVPLLMRDRFENRRFYLFSTLLLFAICTIMVIDVTIISIQQAYLQYDFAKTKDWRPYVDYLMYNRPKLALYAGYAAIPALANIIAEAMLIHRCYIIWGRRKRVAIPLVILSAISSLLFLGASVLALAGLGNMGSERGAERGLKLLTYTIIFQFVGLLMSAVVNVLVTLLTAGRIWWVNRQSQAHVGVSEKKNTRKLSTAIRIILESGMIYPTVMVVYIITERPLKGGPVDLTSVVVLSAGIAPTLALLRAQMTKLSERATFKVGFERVSDIRFNSVRLARLGRTSTVTHTISLDIRASNTGEVLKPPEPLVHPRQSNGLPSSPTRETCDIEKGSV